MEEKRENFDEIYYPSNINEIVYKDTDIKVVDKIIKANQNHIKDTAIVFYDQKIKYSEVFEKINNIAVSLSKLGLKKGDYITVCLPNMPESVYYFYACNVIGVTPYFIDPRSSFERIKHYISVSNSKAFICFIDSFNKIVAPKLSDIKGINTIVVSLSDSFSNVPKSFEGFLAYMMYSAKVSKLKRDYKDIRTQKEFESLCNKNEKAVAIEYDPDIPCIVLNTSGTSGLPKGAIHSNKSYNIFANQVKENFDQIKRGYKYLAYVPFFSMYGSTVGMHGTMLYGAIADICPKMSVDEFDKVLWKKKPNICIGVPKSYNVVRNSKLLKNKDLSFAKFLAMGGDNISPSDLQADIDFLTEHGMTEGIRYGIGATEAMMIATFMNDKRSRLVGSCGIPYPCTKIRISDHETGEELPLGTEGELYVHTPTLMLGYIGNEEETKNSFFIDPVSNEKYYKTGDKGYLSEDGHLYVVGRYKRLMKRPDGHQVSPIPIEDSICSNENVKECAVVGIKRKDKPYGVIPTAFIALKSDGNPNDFIVPIIKDSLSKISGERELALAYVFIDSIPMTENGKVDFVKLQNNTFENLDFYVLSDVLTKGYFENMPNAKFVDAL